MPAAPSPKSRGSTVRSRTDSGCFLAIGLCAMVRTCAGARKRPVATDCRNTCELVTKKLPTAPAVGAIVPAPVPPDETMRNPAVSPEGANGPSSRELGKYRLIAEIGRGGMGVVHLAVLRGLEGFRKLVVVKELRPEVLDTEACVAMFMAEARVAARLNHPNIVQTIEVGADAARRFIAMEYLDGQPLQQIVQRALKQSNRMSLRMHLGIIVDVLTALDYAHELRDFDGRPLGVVHRDVSPQNVMVTYEGQTKLLDFGISKTTDAMHETRDGVLQGKMRYMAPEQASGASVDRRADLFAVGAMLWEAVVGHRPWEGMTDGAVLQSLITGAVPRVRDAWPEVDPNLASIVERAMSVEPDARYSTAGEMRADLERYIGTRDMTPPKARSLGASVSRLFAEERGSRQALIDTHIRALTPGSPPRASSSPAVKLATPPRLPPEFILSPPPSGAPSSIGSSSISLTPPATVTQHGADGTSPAQAGHGRNQSIMTIAAAAAFGAFLAVAAVMVDRLRAGDSHSVSTVGTASAPVQVAAHVTPAGATPRKTHVVVVASPAAARLYLDDVSVPNPYVAEHPSDTTARHLRVEADGYETTTRELTFAEDIDLVMSLSPDPPEPSPVAVARRATMHPPQPPPSAPVCEPPYVVDGGGKKHWKLECLDSDTARGAAPAEGPSAPRATRVQPKPIDTGSPYGPYEPSSL
jgi:serine/threonine protein kinase